MMQETEHHPPSPCIGVCTLDPAGKYCLGCYRSLTEIASWTRYNAAQKQAVLEQIETRRDKQSLSMDL